MSRICSYVRKENDNKNNMYADHTSSSNRLAWLTPLSDTLNSNGPWLLVEDHTRVQARSQTASSHRRVTHSYLLQRLSEVLDIPGSCQSNPCCSWQSACGRYLVQWHRSESNDMRLFEQRADDYFSRLELRVDGQPLVIFQEPVWPHLQIGGTPGTGSLSMPLTCLDALETGVLSRINLQAEREQGGSIAAASAA